MFAMQSILIIMQTYSDKNTSSLCYLQGTELEKSMKAH